MIVYPTRSSPFASRHCNKTNQTKAGRIRFPRHEPVDGRGRNGLVRFAREWWRGRRRRRGWQWSDGSTREDPSKSRLGHHQLAGRASQRTLSLDGIPPPHHQHPTPNTHHKIEIKGNWQRVSRCWLNNAHFRIRWRHAQHLFYFQNSFIGFVFVTGVTNEWGNRVSVTHFYLSFFLFLPSFLILFKILFIVTRILHPASSRSSSQQNNKVSQPLLPFNSSVNASLPFCLLLSVFNQWK